MIGLKKYFFVLCALACFFDTLAQTNVPIYGFHQNNQLFVSFAAGTGAANISINEGNFQNKASQINYSSTAHSVISLLKNDNKQNDFSFLNEAFYLVYKGGGDFLDCRIRLWEDNDKSGNLSNGDEIYASNWQRVHSETWDSIYFNLTQFNLDHINGGNNQLDLNNIRAWEIQIKSNQTVNNQNILFDEIGLQTSYEIPSYSGANFKGAFIQLWNDVGCACGNWSVEQWGILLSNMEELCMEELIVQYGLYQDLSWYAPSNLTFIDFQQNTLNNLFEAALESNIKIVLGTYFDESWNHADKSDPNTYSNLLQKQKASIDELHNLFGNHRNFNGWYIPQELNDLEWREELEKSLLFNYLADLSAYLADKNTQLKIMIAPFFNLWENANTIESWYNELFITAPNITHVYPQDGVGIQLKNPAYHVPLYFNKIKNAATQNQVTFGATVENFHQTNGWPINDGNFVAEPTSIEQLKKQMAVANSFAPNHLITFSWKYMQNNGNAQEQQLYNDYQQAIHCIISRDQNPILNEKLITFQQHLNTIHFNQNINDLSVINIEGKNVLSKKHIQSINLNHLSPGVYVLFINKNQREKILIH